MYTKKDDNTIQKVEEVTREYRLDDLKQEEAMFLNEIEHLNQRLESIRKIIVEAEKLLSVKK